MYNQLIRSVLKHNMFLIALFVIVTITGCGSATVDDKMDELTTQENDVAAPILSISGDNPVTLVTNTAYIESGATAIDVRDGNVAVLIAGTVDTAVVGTYSITYSATDAAGNTASVIRVVTVEIPDTTAPVITLTGDAQITLAKDDAYTEEGGNAIDDKDGEVDVVITGSVNNSLVGSYTLSYTATDAAGNVATATRIVLVVIPQKDIVYDDIRRTDKNESVVFPVAGLDVAQLESMEVIGDHPDGMLSFNSGDNNLTFIPNTDVKGEQVLTARFKWVDGRVSNDVTYTFFVEEYHTTIYMSPDGAGDGSSPLSPKFVDGAALVLEASLAADGTKILLNGALSHDYHVRHLASGGTIENPIQIGSYNGTANFNPVRVSAVGDKSDFVYYSHQECGRLIITNISFISTREGDERSDKGIAIHPSPSTANVVFDTVESSGHIWGNSFAADHLIFIHNYIHDNDTIGVYVEKGEVKIIQNELHDNGDKTNTRDWNFYLSHISGVVSGNHTYNAPGLIKLRAVQDFVLKHNYGHDGTILGITLGGEGVTRANTRGLKRVEIYQNKIVNSKNSLLIADSDAGLFGITLPSDEVIIWGNIFSYQISAWGGDTGAALSVVRSTIGDDHSGITIVGNTFDGQAVGKGGYIHADTGATVLNNIFISSNTDDTWHAGSLDVRTDEGSAGSISNNLLFSPVGAKLNGAKVTLTELEDQTLVENSIDADPLLDGDYIPAEASPAKGAGSIHALMDRDFFGNTREGSLTIGAVQ